MLVLNVRILIKIFLCFVFLNTFFLNDLKAHPGNTNAGGCHMDYSRQSYHCHKTKTPNPYAVYYYVHYRGSSYGPYSSYNSCMSALRGANLIGAYCSTYK